MSDPFAPFDVPLSRQARIVLQAMADAGILGETPEEVASYLIRRELDDLLRCGVVRLDTKEA